MLNPSFVVCMNPNFVVLFCVLNDLRVFNALFSKYVHHGSNPIVKKAQGVG